MNSKYENLTNKFDLMIKQGDGSKVVSLLRPLIKKGVPRPARLPLANIARRCGQPLLSLHLLRPIVRAERKLAEPASPAERACFGAGLISIGAVEEGFEIFKQIDAELYPEVLLHSSLAHISRWDYQKAIAPLEQYIANPRISVYQRLIGKLNLADALNFVGNYVDAQKILHECLKELASTKNSNRFAKQVAHEYLAQSYLHYGGKAKARASLRAAQKAASGSLPNTIFAAKWAQVIKLQSKRKLVSNDAKELYRVREQAMQASLWEGVRDVDYQLARFGFRPDLVGKLRLGTPLGSYQQKLQNQFGDPPVHESVYWQPGHLENSTESVSNAQNETPHKSIAGVNDRLPARGAKRTNAEADNNDDKALHQAPKNSTNKTVVFNLKTGEITLITMGIDLSAIDLSAAELRLADLSSMELSFTELQATNHNEIAVKGQKENKNEFSKVIKQKMFSQGGLPLRFMQVLSEDFYVPARLGRVFRALYPDENFNPTTSPKRVAQLAFRINNFFKIHGIDLKIVSYNYSLSFVTGSNVYLLKTRLQNPRYTESLEPVNAVPQSMHRYRSMLENARHAFGNLTFSTIEFSEWINLPTRSVRRILNWGVSQGILQAMGHKKSTRYRF